MDTAEDVAILRGVAASLMDVLEEAVIAMETGVRPDKEWVSVVQKTFGTHRKELGLDTSGGGSYGGGGEWVR